MATKERWHITKRSKAPVKRTRKFGGKTYKLIKWYFGRQAAEVAKTVLEKRGYSARITEKKKGFTGSPNYYLWARRK